MDQRELDRRSHKRAEVWNRFREAKTEREGFAILDELFSMWPYNRSEKEKGEKLVNEDADICPPHGTPRPDLTLYQLADDVPLVFWDVKVFRQSPGFVRVTTFISADKRKTDHIVETGPSLAGPWYELKREL